MKKSFLVAFMFAFVAVSTAVMMPSKSEAIPAFARQVGMGCTSCHFMHFPKLNAFGRAFKLGGFTDVGEQELLEDDHLSIPSVLNMAALMKTRYQKESFNDNRGAGTATLNRGQIQIPDEMAIFAAGRAGEHWGFMTEYNMVPGAAGTAGNKLVFSMPVAFGKAGLAIATSGSGMGFGMELWNTGVQSNVRMFEINQNAISNVGAIGDATTVQVFAGGDLFFVTGGLFAPVATTAVAALNTSLDLGQYARVAFTPNFAGFDLMIGAGGTFGSTTTSAAGAVTQKTYHNSGFIDFQAQGEIAGMATEIQAMYAAAGKNLGGQGGQAAAAVNTTATGAGGTSWNVQGEIALLPVAGIGLSYAKYKNGGLPATDWNATSLNGYYELAQNLEIYVGYQWRGGNATKAAAAAQATQSKSRLTVMLETVW